MTATASLRWLGVRQLGATLVALWCCTVAAQPSPAADTATRAATAATAAATAPGAVAPAPTC
ncbi:hypothetical protein, partial [Burkholderia sp. IMCC1007]|uniref:hypothetical protein n=1 Tax=Burkholderia sp. IMCC1007 TaxID=3004104 RepID=UPI003FA4D503